MFFPFRWCNSVLMESQPPAISTFRSKPIPARFTIWLFLGVLLDPSISRRFNKRFLYILYAIIAFSILWWITKAELQRFWRETIKDRIYFSLRCFRAILSSCCVSLLICSKNVFLYSILYAMKNIWHLRKYIYIQ